MVMLNLFFILMVEFIALRLKYKEFTLQQSNFLDDIKTCIRAAASYVIIIVVFIVAYYYLIHPELYDNKITATVDVVKEQVSTTELFDQLKRDDMSIPPETTPDEYIANAKENAERLFGWWFIAGGSLLLLIAVSIFNSVFVTLLYRKVLLK